MEVMTGKDDILIYEWYKLRYYQNSSGSWKTKWVLNQILEPNKDGVVEYKTTTTKDRTDWKYLVAFKVKNVNDQGQNHTTNLAEPTYMDWYFNNTDMYNSSNWDFAFLRDTTDYQGKDNGTTITSNAPIYDMYTRYEGQWDKPNEENYSGGTPSFFDGTTCKYWNWKLAPNQIFDFVSPDMNISFFNNKKTKVAIKIPPAHRKAGDNYNPDNDYAHVIFVPEAQKDLRVVPVGETTQIGYNGASQNGIADYVEQNGTKYYPNQYGLVRGVDVSQPFKVFMGLQLLHKKDLASIHSPIVLDWYVNYTDIFNSSYWDEAYLRDTDRYQGIGTTTIKKINPLGKSSDQFGIGLDFLARSTDRAFHNRDYRSTMRAYGYYDYDGSALYSFETTMPSDKDIMKIAVKVPPRYNESPHLTAYPPDNTDTSNDYAHIIIQREPQEIAIDNAIKVTKATTNREVAILSNTGLYDIETKINKIGGNKPLGTHSSDPAEKRLNPNATVLVTVYNGENASGQILYKERLVTDKVLTVNAGENVATLKLENVALDPTVTAIYIVAQIDEQHLRLGQDTDDSNNKATKLLHTGVNLQAVDLTILPNKVNILDPPSKISLVARIYSNYGTPVDTALKFTGKGVTGTLVKQNVTLHPGITEYVLEVPVNKSTYSSGDYTYAVEVNPDRNISEHWYDGSDPYRDNIASSILSAFKGDLCNKALYPTIPIIKKTWQTKYMMSESQGKLYTWTTGGEPDGNGGTTPIEYHSKCIDWKNYDWTTIKAHYEQFIIKDILFKSRATEDKWVSIINSSASSTKGKVPAGSGFELKVLTEYTTDATQYPSFKRSGDCLSQDLSPKATEVSTTNVNCVLLPPNNIRFTSNHISGSFTMGDVYKTMSNDKLDPLQILTNENQGQTKVSGSWTGQTKTYEPLPRQKYGITTRAFFIHERVDDGRLPLLVYTGLGSGKDGDLWDEKLVYFEVKGGITNYLTEQRIEITK